MASLIKNLTDILDEEYKYYKELLEISNQKTEIVIQNKVNDLEPITNKEQRLASNLLKLEKTREELVSDIAIVLNIDKKQLNMTSLIELLKTAEDDQNKLKQLKKNINEILLQLKEKNNQNKMLIEQSIEYIDFTVNALQSTKFNAKNKGYQSCGNEVEGYGENRFFDAKQ